MLTNFFLLKLVYSNISPITSTNYLIAFLNIAH